MLNEHPLNEIQKVENEIYRLHRRLESLRKESPAMEVKNYIFHSLNAEVTLRDLFADKSRLIAIHNMGQGCRSCTLWGDGLNGFLPALEDQFAVVMLSKDAPEEQRRFANSRGWRFNMVSHGGGLYIREQSVLAGQNNMPGIVCYEKKGERIFRKNSSVFGPGDDFCALWSILSLAGVGMEEWTPQYSYWRRPERLEDGGQNLSL
nr:hypothetical protein HAGR004_04010 [Bdellovibrio sp. HAGR004]